MGLSAAHLFTFAMNRGRAQRKAVFVVTGAAGAAFSVKLK